MAAANVAAATPVAPAVAMPPNRPRQAPPASSVSRPTCCAWRSPRVAAPSPASWLKDYPIMPEHPEDKFRLFKPEPPNMFIAQSGLLGAEAKSLPTHEATFTSAQTSYTLGDRDNTLDVVPDLGPGGRGSGDQALPLHPWQLPRRTGAGGAQRQRRPLDRPRLHPTPAYRPARSQRGPVRLHLHRCGLLQSARTSTRRSPFDDMRKQRLDATVTDGWIAMMQHYFVAAWVPPRGQEDSFYTNVLGDDRYIIGRYSPAVSLAAGASHSFADRLYLGPKLPETMAAVAPGLELTVDYGMLAIIAQPIHWLLSKIHSVVGNWGWAIIILTILIKGAFYPLSAASYRSMAHMRQVTPAHPGPQGPLRGRQGAPQHGHDGSVQEGEDQPLGRVPADPGPDPGLHRPVLGPAGERGAAPGPLRPVDPEPDGAGPLLHPAAAHGRVHVHPAEAQPAAAGPHPGQGDDGPALRLHRLLRLLPGGPGPRTGR